MSEPKGQLPTQRCGGRCYRPTSVCQELIENDLKPKRGWYSAETPRAGGMPYRNVGETDAPTTHFVTVAFPLLRASHV